MLMKIFNNNSYKNCLFRQFSTQIGVNLKIDEQRENGAGTEIKRDPEWEHAMPFERIPGPSKLSFIRYFLPGGELYEKGPIEMHELFRKRYGIISIVPALLGHNAMVTTFNPEDFRKVFRTEGVWPIRRGLDTFDYYRKEVRPDVFKGNSGLVAEQGENWSRFRTTVNPVMMQPKSVKLYVPKIDNVTAEFIERIKHIRNPRTLEMPENFENEINLWAFETVGLIALDARLGLINDSGNSKAKKAFAAFKTFLSGMYEFDIKPSIWKYYKTKKFREYMSALDIITDIVIVYLDEAKTRFEKNGKNENDDHDQSVLERLLTADQHIAYIMAMDMLFGGIENISSGFISCLYQLAKNPEKQLKLREELKNILPNKNSPLTTENMKTMPYLRACIKETFRISPNAIGNFRTTGQDVVLSGYQVPKGTDVIMGSLILQKDNEVFQKANEFIPERWLREQPTEVSCPAGKTVDPFVYLPFGFGPRMCIGKRFAELEMESVLSRIIRNFEVEWNHPDFTYRTNALVTNIPDCSLKFKFSDVKN